MVWLLGGLRMVLFLDWLLAWLLALAFYFLLCFWLRASGFTSGFTSCKGIRILEADWGRVFPRRRRRHLPIRVGLAEAQAWGVKPSPSPNPSRLKPSSSRLKPRPIQKKSPVSPTNPSQVQPILRKPGYSLDLPKV